MPMPKAPMNEDDLATRTKYEIGAAGKAPITESVPKSEGVDERSHRHFRGGVATTNPAKVCNGRKGPKRSASGLIGPEDACAVAAASRRASTDGRGGSPILIAVGPT